MSEKDTTRSTRTTPRIVDVITAWIADELGQQRARVPPTAHFEDLGLTAIQRVALAAHLAKVLAIRVPATITREHRTIEQLARHATELVERRGAR